MLYILYFFSLLIVIRSICSNPPIYNMFTYDIYCTDNPEGQYENGYICIPTGCTECGTPNDLAQAECRPNDSWDYIEHTGCYTCCVPNNPWTLNNIDLWSSCEPYTAVGDACTFTNCNTGYCGTPSGSVDCVDGTYENVNVIQGCGPCVCNDITLPSNPLHVVWDCDGTSGDTSCTTLDCQGGYCGTPAGSIDCVINGQTTAWQNQDITAGCTVCVTGCLENSLPANAENIEWDCPSTSIDTSCNTLHCASGYCGTPTGTIDCNSEGTWENQDITVGCTTCSGCDEPVFNGYVFAGCEGVITPHNNYCYPSDCCCGHCCSPEGYVRCNDGDWIVEISGCVLPGTCPNLPDFAGAGLPGYECYPVPTLPVSHQNGCETRCTGFFCGDTAPTDVATCINGVWDFSAIDSSACQSCLAPCADIPSYRGYVWPDDCFQSCDVESCADGYTGDAFGSASCWDDAWVFISVSGCSGGGGGGGSLPIGGIIGGGVGIILVSVAVFIFVYRRKRTVIIQGNTYGDTTSTKIKPKKLPPNTSPVVRKSSPSPVRSRSTSPKKKTSDKERERKKKDIQAKKDAIRKKRASSPPPK